MSDETSSGAVSVPSLIRLSPAVAVEAIPYHQSFETVQDKSKAPPLNAFVKSALDEAYEFATKQLPSFTPKGSRKSPPSIAPVQNAVSDIVPKPLSSAAAGAAAGGKPEYWVSRSSTHGGQRVAGDATWDEFQHGLKQDHSQHEQEYTPSVKEAVEVARWSAEAMGAVDGWSGTEAAVYEMVHSMPGPLLKDRLFTILAVSGYPASDPDSFVTLTVPLDVGAKATATEIPSAKYAGSAAVVQAQYVSIEYVHKTADGSIVWEMATASDAKGNLPMALQKLGIASAITKDVGLFLGWVDKNRSES
jgi:hypothetical protein